MGQSPDTSNPSSSPSSGTGSTGDPSSDKTGQGHSSSLPVLMLGALGVVFGDIGTSPLYAIREAFSPSSGLAVTHDNILGILSLFIWSITLVVSVKYVVLVMRADNKGEGGAFALMTLVHRAVHNRPFQATLVTGLGLAAACLFYGDSVITPAVSVMSAVEGLEIAIPHMGPWVDPLTMLILLGLFAMQKMGTDGVGKIFGPLTLIWFISLAAMGLHAMQYHWSVLAAFSPHYAVEFLIHNGFTGFTALGAVVLAVTGAEALYADMGHFGRLPIRLVWYFGVMPALILNYLGQGAILLHNPHAIANPFFHMVPPLLTLPLVILATFATIIASQAVISGAFSLTWQAIHLDLLPRMRIVHTSRTHIGQIYIPTVNWLLMVAVLALVPLFESSDALASAYGLAVTAVMVITLILLAMAMHHLWGWKPLSIAVVCIILGIVDVGLFAANVTKFMSGGWFPVSVACLLAWVIISWRQGKRALEAAEDANSTPIGEFLAKLPPSVRHVPGTAVHLTSPGESTPTSLIYNLRHNKIIHEHIILLTVEVDDVPLVPPDRIEVARLTPYVQRITIHYGYQEPINIPRAFARATEEELGFFYEPMAMTYFLSRNSLQIKPHGVLPWWQRGLFHWLNRSAGSATDYFQLPPDRVVELGGQIVL